MKKALQVFLILLVISCSSDKENIVPKNIPTVIFNSISDITENTAIISANVTNDGGASVTSRGVCWNTITSPTVNHSKTIDGSGIGEFTSQMTSLFENTTYFVRAYAVNSEGISYSNELSFNTDWSNLPPEDFEVSVNDITDSSAVLDWNPGSNDPDGNQVSYKVILEGEVIVESTFDKTFVLENLTELTSYSGFVIAKDEYGDETSSEYSFTTIEYFHTFYNEYDFYYGPYASNGHVYSMIETNDGDFVLSGKCSWNGNGSQFFALKIDAEGNEIWKKFYGYYVDEAAEKFNIIQASDNNLLLAGHVYLLKIDINSGNLIWDNVVTNFGYPYNFDGVIKGIEEHQGDIYVVGTRDDPSPEIKTQGVLAKLDSNGNFIWEKIINPSYRTTFEEIMITNSNELIIAGSTDSSGVLYEEYADSDQDTEIDFYIIKSNLDGDIMWEHTFGDNQENFPSRIIETMDGNYVAVGNGGYNINSYKIDPTGNLIWEEIYPAGNTVFANSIVEADDGSFMTIGYYHFVYGDANTLFVSKSDSSGNTLSVVDHVLPDYTYRGMDIKTLPDGSYLIAATKYNGIGKIVVIKTDAEGNF